MICQNQSKCTKGPSGPDGRPCQRKSHDGCDTRPCINIATNGPDNSRVYCPVCVTQLKLRTTHPCNSKHCIACGKLNKAKYGERTSDGPIRATHCAECAKSVGYVLAGSTLCSFRFEDGTMCNSQAKVKSDESAFCGTHAVGKDDCQRKNTCKEDGCTLAQVAGAYCTAHAKERGICRKDNCADCKSVRGTYKDGKDLLCRGCRDKRVETNAELDITSINALCEVCDEVRPSFAPTESGKPLRCKGCCEGLDWRCVTNQLCEVLDCNQVPRWALPGQSKPLRCDAHVEKSDVNPKACQHCKLANSSGMKCYAPYCAGCFFFLFPENPRTKRYKTKEQAFMIPLKELYPSMTLDKTIDGGCSKKRPDGFVDCLTHSVIVEIDEDQHAGYEDICENRRMMEIFSDLGSRPIVFVRLNPDSYYRSDGKMIQSIFRKRNGTMGFNQKEFDRRYALLTTTVANSIAAIPTKSITVERLYFSTTV